MTSTEELVESPKVEDIAPKPMYEAPRAMDLGALVGAQGQNVAVACSPGSGAGLCSTGNLAL